MIRNRLAILLVERGLKITQVAKDTGISRNTITSTAQNDGKMIQLQTIDLLCTYLNVTPNDFFEFTPLIYNFSLFLDEENFDIKPVFSSGSIKEIIFNSFTFDCYLDVTQNKKTKSFALIGRLINYESNEINVSVIFDNEEERKVFKSDIWDNLNVGFQGEIKQEMEKEILEEIIKTVKKELDSMLEHVIWWDNLLKLSITFDADFPM